MAVQQCGPLPPIVSFENKGEVTKSHFHVSHIRKKYPLDFTIIHILGQQKWLIHRLHNILEFFILPL